MFIYLLFRLISFETNLKTTDFKRNLSGRTPIYEYTPPLPINDLVAPLLVAMAQVNWVPGSGKVNLQLSGMGCQYIESGCHSILLSKHRLCILLT